MDKAVPLCICRVFLLLLRQRRGAAGLGELQWTRGQNNCFATAPAHTRRALHGANSSKGWSGKTTSFFRSGSRERATDTEFFTFLNSSRPFSLACSQPPVGFFA
jgi:hypothetical protein